MSTEEQYSPVPPTQMEAYRKRWFVQDRVVQALRDSFRAHGIEATEEQIEKVAKDIADDWDRLLD